ncbi:sulfatase-like hydrolase/transferase, partial [Acidobacteriota bacterium]
MAKKKRRKQRKKKPALQGNLQENHALENDGPGKNNIRSKPKKIIFFLIPLALVMISAVLFFLLSRPKHTVIKDSGLNVCLITLDTTRADRIGCYGYDNAKTPNLDYLAANGVKLSNAYCQVPLTLPSHCSIFTGTYPVYHRVHNNGSYSLDPRHISLAEVLREKGFKTAAFVSSFTVDSRYGIDQGFEFYDDTLQEEEIIKNYRSQRRAEEVYNSFANWMDTNLTSRFFCWIHFFDPHLPYDPPFPFREEFSGSPYDGEIAYMDVYIGKVVEKLREKNLLDRTLIILVGDHGEALREKNELDHGIFIYDTTLRVPFILYCPKNLPQGLVVDSRVRLVDVMPTVLDLLGIPENDEIQGRTLVPYIEGRKKEDLSSYIETYYPRENFGWSELIGFIDREWKYIRAPKEELYDIKGDPAEEQNVIFAEKKSASTMKKKLKDFIENHSSNFESTKKKLTTEEVERLRSLGYMGAEFTEERTEGNLPDPKDRIDEFHILFQAKLYEYQQKYDLAIENYNKIIALEPRMPMNYYHLALVYMKTDRYPEAAEVLKKGIQSVPNPYVLLSRLAVIYIKLNRLEEAQEANQAALTMKPDHLDSLITAGRIMTELGKHAQSIEYYTKALKIESENKRLQIAYAFALVSVGRIDEALDIYERLKAAYPDDYKIYEDIGIAQASKGNTEKALINFKKAVELN